MLLQNRVITTGLILQSAHALELAALHTEREIWSFSRDSYLWTMWVLLNISVLLRIGFKKKPSQSRFYLWIWTRRNVRTKWREEYPAYSYVLSKSTKTGTNAGRNYFMHNAFSVWLLLYRGIWTCRLLRENTWSAETWESLLSQRVFQVCSHSPLVWEPSARRRGRGLGSCLESHQSPGASLSGWLTRR